jgi:hypothetical protein
VSGVPDWKSSEGYPPIDAPATGWAWEFLRRNPAYRQFWEEKVAPYIETIRDHTGEFSVIGRNVRGEMWPYKEELRQTFGIDVPSSPGGATPPKFDAHWTRYVTPDCGEPQTLMLIESEVAFVIDLARPLKPQFDGALVAAQKMQNESFCFISTRQRRDKYCNYLRILDGLDTGEDEATVAGLIFADRPNVYPEFQRTDTFRKAREVAIRMRDGGWRALIEAAPSGR